METYKVIGLMSGTSMDGLDIAYCEITEDNGQWSYKILKSACEPFPVKWKLRLEKLVLQNAITYIKTHTFFGHFIGGQVKSFIEKNNLQGEVDFIASHGQTLFHQPENRFTSQIGDGAAIAVQTGLPVICDFRTTDVALGGQGTPIIPVADKLFFSEYKYIMNLGGIANITCKLNDRYIAFDITAVNLILNKLAKKLGQEFDRGGENARKGLMDEQLMEELNASWYYEKDYPKSLSGGWVSKVMIPVVSRHELPVEDKLRTLTEHIAVQISNAVKMVQEKEGINISKSDKMLVTGGGAFNTYLIERIESLAPMSLHVPDDETVNFKEALMIALMGVLRVRNEINCLSSVTGAERDCIGGTIYQGLERQLKTSIN